MSYDLAVFDPTLAPHERVEFLKWFKEQTKWKEPHSYDDPKISTPTLCKWFLEMIVEFPSMNGLYAPVDLPEDDATLTDYSVGNSLIYAAFAWSKAEKAYKKMFCLAEKYQLGFFNVSSDTSDVWLPDRSGRLILVHCG